MRALFASLILFISTATVVAQDIEFQVMPAANKVGTQDAFEVRYVVKNANRAQSFSLNELRDVQVVGGPSQSSSISIMNGERSVSLEITYVFKAKRKGSIVLPVGIISIDGREYKSNAVGIAVIEGTVRTQTQRRSRNPFDDPFLIRIPLKKMYLQPCNDNNNK
ncbi:MAG: BatD family protein [Bacteroidetes bacterium]|nr:BatD family protein [Bacteroidota bacterium]